MDSATTKDSSPSTSSGSSDVDSVKEAKKIERPYRQGLKYNTMKAEATILHQREYVTYRTKDGKLVTAFYPKKKPTRGSVSETLSEDVVIDNSRIFADVEEQILRSFPETQPQ